MMYYHTSDYLALLIMVVILVGIFIFGCFVGGSNSALLNECQKKHNVFKCQIVALPVAGDMK